MGELTLVYDISIVAEHDFEDDSSLIDEIEKLCKNLGWKYSIISRPLPEIIGPITLEGGELDNDPQ